MKETIRIGCGAGFSGDRLEPAVLLAEKGRLDYLVLECLAERTIALAQKRKRSDPMHGYDPLLERRILPLLPLIKSNRFRLITNMGAANPLAAAAKIAELARAARLQITVAAVTGDDVFDILDPSLPAMETGAPVGGSGKAISANAYMGVEGILEALQTNADIIVTGRVADPSLFLAPMIYEFGWDIHNFDLLGKGTVIGHLLECAGQVTGGYFADGAHKTVAGLDQLGHPLAEVSCNGLAVITKIEGTGGEVSLRTVKEQLLYEVINPFEYYTPDVIADFTTVSFKQQAPNRVAVSGGSGKAKPAQFKVSVGFEAFFLGEAEISYAGMNALEKAELAADILQKRLGNKFPDLSFDYAGLKAIHHTNFNYQVPPYEIRLRVAAKAESFADAALVGEEVEALYTNGPAAGGGVRKYVNEVIGILSVLMNRDNITHYVTLFAS